MKQSKKIAITGGIGSGKTEFCRILAEMGYPVYSCDEISDELWQDAAYVKGIFDLFPACKTKRDVAAFVFRDPTALERLNAYAHPKIVAELLRRMQGRISFGEVPLLFEGGYESLFDAVIALHRDLDGRMEAVSARDGLSREEIEGRIRAQISPEELLARGCIVVENDGDLAALSRKAKEALRLLGEDVV